MPVDASVAFEEETLPHYTCEAFYPARNGEIIHDRYQLGAKMGYGTTSTVWLAQDVHMSYDTLDTLSPLPI